MLEEVVSTSYLTEGSSIVPKFPTNGSYWKRQHGGGQGEVHMCYVDAPDTTFAQVACSLRQRQSFRGSNIAVMPDKLQCGCCESFCASRVD